VFSNIISTPFSNLIFPLEANMAASQKYVDTFVMPLSKSKLGAYAEFAQGMANLAKKHGALEYVNCIGDDIKPGNDTSFPHAVKLHDDEVVAQSWAVYKSREDRDRANKAIMEDAGFKKLSQHIPVDGKRMFTGGFTVLRGL
jgi:uncharacterized protein YbaA (DUF1428 family)